MKHSLKIGFILLLMFLATQFIGLYVVNFYSPVQVQKGISVNVSAPSLPLGLETPQLQKDEFNYAFVSILFAFAIAVSLLLLLTRINAEFFLKLWFFLVIIIALVISFNVFASAIKFFTYEVVIFSRGIPISWILASLIALPLAYFKIYKRNFIVHNATELLVYPGIAAVFVPIVNIYTISLLLIAISVYDAWAVWHSGIMQKMAKYQINKLNIFSGFFVPYASKKVRLQMQKMRNSSSAKSGNSRRIKVNVAILGGGDVVFPIITAGVMMKTLGLLPAIFVILGAALGLGLLFIFSEKKKFYPAMPFITAGIFLGIAISYLAF